MKTRHLLLLALLSVLVIPASNSLAGDCGGSWQVLKNRGGQSPCRALGLDSKRGTCRPGDTYETLCDDAKNGRYKICQGSRLCSGQAAPQGNKNNCSNWDYTYNRPCPQGYTNSDCRGGCEPAGQSSNNNCSNWDYTYNQPCPPGYINRDCRGGCEK